MTVDKTFLIELNGHPEPYRLDANAYQRLERYLERAASRLRVDPDQAEILGDIERSVGDKLAALLASGDRLVTVADIDGVLEQVGAVETGPEPPPAATVKPPRPRRLQRIRTSQKVAGVCAGIAAYSQLDVDWVRTFFLFATVLTAGAFGLVYVALAFILPVAESES
jgi:phage shock protein PspC (stress-responsive transcriptional regulator)